MRTMRVVLLGGLVVLLLGAGTVGLGDAAAGPAALRLGNFAVVNGGPLGMVSAEVLRPWDYTPQDWAAARGLGNVRFDMLSRSATFRLAFSGLVPGGVYSLWLVHQPEGTDKPYDQSTVMSPLGIGTAGMVSELPANSNAFIAGSDGFASLTITVRPFYPRGLMVTEGKPYWNKLGLAWHPLGVTHGALPGPVYYSQLMAPLG